MSEKTCNRILNLELITGMIASIIVGIVGERIPRLYWSRMCWIALVILAINFGLKIYGKNKHSAEVIGKWLSSLTLILVFNFLIYTTVSMINLTFKPFMLISSIVGLLLLMVINIPVVIINFSIAQNWFTRLFLVFILYLNYICNVNSFLGTSPIINQILHSGVVTSFATFILAFFIAKAWQLKFNWNLKLIKSQNFQWLTLFLLLIISVWFAFFNAFVALAPSLKDLICFWNWDFSTFEITTKAIFKAVAAGVFEETIRCLNLIILLLTMHNFKYRVFFATAISSILFSLSHLCNLGGNILFIKFDLTLTLQQLVYTLGTGMLFAVIYLYTGKLWLSMLIHGLLDFIVFSETPLTQVVTPLISNGWIVAIILLLVPLAIALLMMVGKRRKFMEENADRIVGNVL